MPRPEAPALVDHHCHSVVAADLADDALAALLTESDRPPAPGCSPFDSALGLAVRRWCPPVLGLPVHAPAVDYLARGGGGGGAAAPPPAPPPGGRRGAGGG
ncbi:hypothetical protein ACFV0O_16990 [Kitasatospora sp. NPDC059577]|uniref:hypothetical protein n=1 Tax=Kitasatospora sp. NPDC059577 TaxID=3346873 RepID=UPI0036B3EE02